MKTTTLTAKTLFSVLALIKNGYKINVIVTQFSKSFNSAIRSFYQRTVKAAKKTIIVKKDVRFDNIYNIVAEKTNVPDFTALGFITVTQFQTLSAKGITVVIL